MLTLDEEARKSNEQYSFSKKMISAKINDTMHYGSYSDSIVYEEENKYEETQSEEDVPNL